MALKEATQIHNARPGFIKTLGAGGWQVADRLVGLHLLFHTLSVPRCKPVTLCAFQGLLTDNPGSLLHFTDSEVGIQRRHYYSRFN